MEFGKAFTFPFKDPEWFKKVIIVALVSLIPIVGQLILIGWSLQITRKVIEHDPNPFPSLKFGEDLGRGFGVFVIELVYSLPIIIIAIPFGLIMSNLSNSSNGDVVFWVISGCFAVLSIVYGIFLAFILPAALGNYAAIGKIGAGLRIGENFRHLGAAPLAYLIAILGVLVSSIIAPFGTILCGIGVLLTAVYAMAIAGHLYGQAYNQAVAHITQ